MVSKEEFVEKLQKMQLEKKKRKAMEIAEYARQVVNRNYKKGLKYRRGRMKR